MALSLELERWINSWTNRRNGEIGILLALCKQHERCRNTPQTRRHMPADHRKNAPDKSDPTRKTGRNNANPKNAADARHDKSQQAENRKELGVGEDHKTKDMEQKNRGTFP